MDDLRRRFATLDAVPTPVDWATFEAQTRAGATGAMRVGRVRIADAGSGATGSTTSRGLAFALLAALLVAALVGLAIVGGRFIDQPSPSVAVPSAPAVAPTTSAAPSEEPSAEASVRPSASPTGLAACPGVVRPTELRITPLELQDFDTGPLGEPVVAGCAAWIPSGDNFGGVHRVDLATGAVSLMNPPEYEIVFDVDTNGEELWATVSPTGHLEDHATLVRIDPATSTIAEVVAVDTRSYELSIVGGLAYLGDHRSGGIDVFDLASREIVGTVDGWEHTIDAGGDVLLAWTIGRQDMARIDAETLEALPMPGVPFGNAVMIDGRLFVASDEGRVVGFDPDTTEVETTWQLDRWTPGGAIALAFDGTSLWAAPMPIVELASGQHLQLADIVRIDTATGQPAERIALEVLDPAGVHATEGNLWVYNSNSTLTRIELPATP